jgi:hypothetical protein
VVAAATALSTIIGKGKRGREEERRGERGETITRDQSHGGRLATPPLTVA